MIYGSAAMGTTVHLHYCMSKFVGWSLINSRDNQCHSCGMEKKGGCCTDSKAQIKLADEQQKAESSYSKDLNFQIVSTAPDIKDFYLADRDVANILFVQKDAPPLLPQFDTPEFLCVFRI